MMNVSLPAHSSASCLPHRSPSYAAICCHCRCWTFQKLHLHASNHLQEVISLLPTPCCAVLGASLWGVMRSEPRRQTYSTFSHSLFHVSRLTDRNFFEHHKCSCVRVCKELVAQPDKECAAEAWRRRDKSFSVCMWATFIGMNGAPSWNMISIFLNTSILKCDGYSQQTVWVVILLFSFLLSFK